MSASTSSRDGETISQFGIQQLPVIFVEIQGIRTAHAVIGAGQPIVMLHGWGADMSLLWPFAQHLERKGYRLYLLDLPGFGQTSAPLTAWTVFDYAAFVLAYLDSQGLDHVYLFGHSFGGRLGLILGAEHPERLIKMALADGAGVRPKSSGSGQLRLKTYKLALNVLRGMGLTAPAERLRAWYSNRYGSADYKAATGVMREIFVKVVNEDLLPYAARVRVSTLLFWGSHDLDTPLAQGQLLEKTIPDAGLVVWDGAGHYSYLERAADTARVLAHFFSS